MAAPPNPRSTLWIDALVLTLLAAALALSYGVPRFGLHAPASKAAHMR